jgi:hypothetical protein
MVVNLVIVILERQMRIVSATFALDHTTGSNFLSAENL